MRKLNLLLIIPVLLFYSASAQVASRATPVEINKVGSVTVSDIKEDYMPV